MKRYKQSLTIITLLSLTIILGCTKQDPTYEPTKQETTDYTSLTNKGQAHQSEADEAKQLLSRYDEVSEVHAINNDKTLIVAIKIEQGDRFSLDHLEKEFQEKLQHSFPHLKTAVSTDQKILFELNELENKLANDNLSNKTLNKHMKKIKKLMKEET